MRADRLLSLLMLLQARGRMTARQLGKELEVSERTIYRDIDALSAAGVPVYGEPGADGGFALLDSYRTSLTGLSEGEVRALFMLSIPAPLAELGVSQDLRSALLKLAAALPDAQRGDEAKARQRFHLDATWWHQGQERVPHLQTIHEALWQDLKVRIVYRPFYATRMERLVAPYGLVAKAGVWYLVYAWNGRVDAYRVSNLLDVHPTEETFVHPGDFDLGAFWTAWCARRERWLSSYTATVRVAPGVLPALPRFFGRQVHGRVAQAGPPDREGWVTLDLSFESFHDALHILLGFGRAVEVLSPRPLRVTVLDFAQQIVELYTA